MGIGATFLLMGAMAGAYGPLLGALTHRFHVSLAVAGATFSAHFLGAFVAVVASMRLLETVAARPFVWSALGCGAAGCAGVALAPTWPVFLAAVVVVGLGFGGLDIGLNSLVAHSEGERRSALLTFLNGAYGLGAVAGPLAVTAAAGDLHILYGGGALFAVAMLGAVAGIRGRLPHESAGGGMRPGLLVALFMLAFVLYVGAEVGIGGWMPSHLESLGQGTATAATFTSGFWLALAVGRLLMPLVPARVPEGTIVIAGSAVAAAALLLAAVRPLAPAAYLLTGFAIAPIFPTAVVWLARRRPRDARATSWLFPATMVGGAVIPGGVGVLIGLFGIGLAPLVLAAVAAGSLGAFALAARSR